LLDQVDPRVKLLFLNKKSGLDISIFKKIRNILIEEKPQVVHTHLRTFIYVQFLIPLYRKILFVHTVHTRPSLEFKSIDKIIANQFFKYSNSIPVTISVEADKDFKKVFPKIKNELIPNGRSFPDKSELFNLAQNELNKFRNKFPNHLIFINIANITPPKNQQLLMRVFSKLHNEKVILLNIGSAKVYTKLFEFLLEIKPNNVFFLGEKENATDYLYGADAFVLSSTTEGAPISLLEAMAIGVTPISTPVGSMKSIIKSGINGFLLPEISEEAMIDAIRKRLEVSTAKLEIMKKSISDCYHANYSIQICSLRYLELFKKDQKK
jgi:glycosyltransferase involved in cell wall biosynthesis